MNEEDRSYVLRFRPTGASEDQYIPITEFNITEYECGLESGDRVELIVDFPVFDKDGVEVTRVHEKGEIWTVLTGADDDPSVLWLRQEDRELHSFDDDLAIFETFRLLKE